MYHSTLGWRVIKKKKIRMRLLAFGRRFEVRGVGCWVSGFGFRVSGLGLREAGRYMTKMSSGSEEGS